MEHYVEFFRVRKLTLHEVTSGLYRVVQGISDKNVVLERAKYETDQPNIQIFHLPVRGRGLAKLAVPPESICFDTSSQSPRLNQQLQLLMPAGKGKWVSPDEPHFPLGTSGPGVTYRSERGLILFGSIKREGRVPCTDRSFKAEH